MHVSCHRTPPLPRHDPKEPMPMKINRRDALKLGGVTVVGGAALGVAVWPKGKEAEVATASISRLAAKDFPKRYVNVIAKTPAAVATMVDGVATYDMTMKISKP